MKGRSTKASQNSVLEMVVEWVGCLAHCLVDREGDQRAGQWDPLKAFQSAESSVAHLVDLKEPQRVAWLADWRAIQRATQWDHSAAAPWAFLMDCMSAGPTATMSAQWLAEKSAHRWADR